MEKLISFLNFPFTSYTFCMEYLLLLSRFCYAEILGSFSFYDFDEVSTILVIFLLCQKCCVLYWYVPLSHVLSHGLPCVLMFSQALDKNIFSSHSTLSCLHLNSLSFHTRDTSAM